MKTAKKIGALSPIACAVLASQAAWAGEDTFINPDWANHAAYIGFGVGQSRANINEQRLIASLTANGAALGSFTTDERGTGGKLFVGQHLNH